MQPQGVTAQGKDYMTLFLQDKSGDIEAKLWTATKDDMQTLKPETIVHVKGDIINYRGRKTDENTSNTSCTS